MPLFKEWTASPRIWVNSDETLAAQLVKISPQGSVRAIGMDFNQACSNLMAEMNHRFDPRPIAALINYLNNRGGAQEWVSFSMKIDG